MDCVCALPIKASSASERAGEDVDLRRTRVGSFVKLTCLLVLFLVLCAAAQCESAHFSGALGTLPIGGLTNPYGMAVDASGNVFVADNATNSITELTPGWFEPESPILNGDGSPYGIAVDGSGNLY